MLDLPIVTRCPQDRRASSTHERQKRHTTANEYAANKRDQFSRAMGARQGQDGASNEYEHRDSTRHILGTDRKSTRLNSSHLVISYAVFCLKKKKKLLY